MQKGNAGHRPAADQHIGCLVDRTAKPLVAAEREIIQNGAEELVARIVKSIAVDRTKVEDIQNIGAVVALPAHADSRSRYGTKRISLIPGDRICVIELETLRETPVELERNCV